MNNKPPVEPVAIKIDVTKVNKDRLFNANSGAKYLDAVIFLRPADCPDQYGQHGMITESLSKDERDNGVKGAILGNAKRLGALPAQGQVRGSQGQTGGDSDDDDIPF